MRRRGESEHRSVGKQVAEIPRKRFETAGFWVALEVRDRYFCTKVNKPLTYREINRLGMLLSGWSLMVLVVAGCSGIGTLKQEAESEFITDKKTDFFTYGPSQPGRPVELEEQEFVTVQRRESVYSIVRLSDERTGWVDSSCLRPAPPSA